MNDNIAIKVENVSKTFKLPHERKDSVKGAFVNIFTPKKSYEKQKVLNNISFEIKKGEFFGIVGRNGSGKSTLLKLLAGIYNPDQGAIHINGSLTPFIELGVGFNPELTGRENVFLNGALLGFNRKEMDKLYDEIVDFAELHKFMDQKLKNYSSGMQVRLAFSIAIRANSEILVLDEVLAVGDANFQKKCFDYFRELKERKTTVILVSHDMESVKKFSDRAMLLEKSKIVLIDSPEKVSDEYMKQNIEKEIEVKAKKGTEESAPKQAQIKSVKLYNSQGKYVKDYDGLGTIEIRIDYELAKNIVSPNIGIGLYSDPWGYVFGYNTQMDKYKITKNQTSLSLMFENLTILPGEYYLNVICFGHDETLPYDFKSAVLRFIVPSRDDTPAYRGILNTKHEWK